MQWTAPRFCVTSFVNRGNRSGIAIPYCEVGSLSDDRRDGLIERRCLSCQKEKFDHVRSIIWTLRYPQCELQPPQIALEPGDGVGDCAGLALIDSQAQ
ncbi:hypothetical protein EP51_39315 (plasmid) [Rhodococcus opacus]|uniref:Uncharacterized protein n=1 Tax=Rhodococcus opacus TaxID=37919 RepID=A0A076EYP6_RHOOP|nr:hypothetical protein EP51_39315 [Rhodococcus opacus]